MGAGRGKGQSSVGVQGWLVGMLLEEVGYEIGFDDVAGRDPGPLLWTVSFLVLQVLETPASAVGADKTTHREHWTTINHTGRRRWWCSRDKRAVVDRLYLGDMEGRVDPHGVGERETDCHRVDNPVNSERPHELQGHLLGVHPQRNVLGGEPNLLASPVGRCWHAPTVG